MVLRIGVWKKRRFEGSNFCSRQQKFFAVASLRYRKTLMWRQIACTVNNNASQDKYHRDNSQSDCNVICCNLAHSYKIRDWRARYTVTANLRILARRVTKAQVKDARRRYFIFRRAYIKLASIKRQVYKVAIHASTSSCFGVFHFERHSTRRFMFSCNYTIEEI